MSVIANVNNYAITATVTSDSITATVTSTPINVTIAGGWTGQVLTQDYKDRLNLVIGFNLSLDAAYAEFTFTGEDLTNVDVWEDDTKATKLFSKTISYDAGNIDEIVLVDEVRTKTMTTVFTYLAGNIATKNTTIT